MLILHFPQPPEIISGKSYSKSIYKRCTDVVLGIWYTTAWQISLLEENYFIL